MSAIVEYIYSLCKTLAVTEQENLLVLNNHDTHLDRVKITESFQFWDASPGARTTCKPINVLLGIFA